MLTLFSGSCHDIAIIETIMRGSGRMASLGEKEDVPLWEVQRDFKSPKFTRTYECAIDKKPTVRLFSNMAKILFFYDNLTDNARIETHKETVISVKDIILTEMLVNIDKIGLKARDKKVLELLKQQGEPGDLQTISKAKAKYN